ncbi:MAG TPA: zinc ribbon domain-containing protein [Candidatus Angelobacter sp.]|nr:zinc ribbon domain-containing protein [Candidatus Angelobacter sp.]
MSIIQWRLNPFSILAAAIALVGALLPWWGFDLSGINSAQAHRWTLWNPPRFNTQIPGAASVSWNFTISSVSVLVLVLAATALVVVGSVTLLRRYLLGGLVLSALAPAVYAGAINYVTMNYCITPFCVSGPVGSESVSRAPGLGVAWGFQSGFYVFLAAVLVLLAGVLFNSRIGIGQVTNGKAKIPVFRGRESESCAKCGANLQSQSKFCPNCGQARAALPLST